MLIKRAVLAAAMVAGAAAYANNVSTNYAVVYCKATISSYDEIEKVSVTLPATEGYYDKEGNPITYWNVGEVPAGGVADSWHQEGGPGRFSARNVGNCSAYFYVTTGCDYIFDISSRSVPLFEPFVNINENTFGNCYLLRCPLTSPGNHRMQEEYHLAFTTDVNAKVPTWHSLDHGLTWDNYNDRYYWDKVVNNYCQTAAYMGYVDPGDYLVFDMKFWAPHDVWAGGSYLFTFCVEASYFPLWDHGRAVE